MARLCFAIGAGYGFLGVALGAFGAHALRTRFAQLEDGAKRLEWWTTGTQYQLVHALVLLVVALVAAREASRATTVAAVAMSVGVLIFSGTLYAMALGAPRWLGAVTPIGGTLLLVGWVALGIAGFRGLS